MSYTRSATPPEPGLGFALALPSVGALANTFGSTVLGAFGFGNPKDAERKARIDAAYLAALGGDPDAEVLLRCMAGEHSQRAVELGYSDGVTLCGLATDYAKTYATAKIAELLARRGAGQIGGTLIGQSDLPARAAATFQGVATSPATWLVVGGLALFLFLRRR